MVAEILEEYILIFSPMKCTVFLIRQFFLNLLHSCHTVVICIHKSSIHVL